MASEYTFTIEALKRTFEFSSQTEAIAWGQQERAKWEWLQAAKGARGELSEDRNATHSVGNWITGRFNELMQPLKAPNPNPEIFKERANELFNRTRLPHSDSADF